MLLSQVLVSGLLLICFCSVESLKVRKAQVRIRNLTGQKLASVGVVHKYSSVYKEKHTWEGVPNGGETDADMTVTYHTGFMTTGVDWWSVNYVLEDGKTMKITNPNNFRKFFDKLEKTAKDFLKSKAAKFLGEHIPAAVSASNSVIDNLLNSEETVGLKQHTLRSKDAGKITVIELTSDHRVRFISPSGISTTVTKTVEMEVKEKS